MQTEDNTRQLLGDLAESAEMIAEGFRRAASTEDAAARGEAMLDALMVLREMRASVSIVAQVSGAELTFTPSIWNVNVCEWCEKTLDAHLGEESKCK